MTGRVDAGRVLLAAALAGPVLVAQSVSGAASPGALAGLLAVTAALLVVQADLRRAGRERVSAASVLLLLYGTSLLWHAVRPGLSALALLAGALATRAWWRRTEPGRTGLPRAALLGLLLAALALAADAVEGRLSAPTVGAPAVLEALFSSRHGVLFWSPLLTLALLGLAGPALRGPGRERGAVVALAVVALVHASLRPWWTGEVGNARVLPALPLLASGLAAALEGLRSLARRRPLRVLAAAGGLLVAWNLLLMAQYRHGWLPRDEVVSFPQAAHNGARLLAAAVGSPTAWPANWLFALRHGLPAARFDLLAGQDVRAATVDVGHLPDDEAALLEGWSVRHPCAEAVCRAVEGRARAVLPMLDRAPARVEVRARGTGTLRAELGEAAASAPLAPAFAELVLPAGPALRRGPNLLVLEVSPGGEALVDLIRVVPSPARPRP